MQWNTVLEFYNHILNKMFYVDLGIQFLEKLNSFYSVIYVYLYN